MISVEEAQKIDESLDGIFKFKIGDIVQPKVLGDYAEIVSGWSAESRDGHPEDTRWTLNFERGAARYQVIERLLQQCHGGVQKHYAVRLVTHDGVVDRQLIQITEDELLPSMPFKRIRGMSLDKVRDWLKSAEAEEKRNKEKLP